MDRSSTPRQAIVTSLRRAADELKYPEYDADLLRSYAKRIERGDI